MSPWRAPWLGLALPPLLWGCALRGLQPGSPPPPPAPPPSCCTLGPEAFWGLSCGQGMLIGACLGCLPALALLCLGGLRRLGWLSRPRRQSPPLALLLRLRFLRRELHKLMAQGHGQANVVSLGAARSRRR